MPDSHRLTTGLLFLTLFTFVMGSRPASPRRASADEGEGATSQYDEAASGDHPANVVARQRASEIAFRQTFDEVGQTDPDERDYVKILAGIHRLCTDHPGSDAAYRAMFAVEQWAKSGYVSQAAAEGFSQWKKRFNPERDRLAELERKTATAIEDRAFDDLHRVGNELQAIAREHPGTVSEFIALANLGPLLYEAGHYNDALSAVDDFIRRFPYESTDYPQLDHYTRMNLFLHARLLVRSKSIDKGIAAYRSIASTFAGREPYELPALYDAGMVALKHERPELALELFDDVIEAFPDSEDSRVTLSRFRMAQSYLAMGDKAAARAIAEKLAADFPGTRWEREAKAFIAFLQTPPPPGKEYEPPTSFQVTTRDVPTRKSDLYLYLIGGNVLGALCIGTVAIVRRRARRDRARVR